MDGLVLYVFSILFIVDVFNHAQSLNYECIPTNNQDTGVANCSAQRLVHVPPNLPHNIRVLDLSNNQITQLEDNAFAKYEFLEVLHIHNNSLSRLEKRVFGRLHNVMYLDLSFNSLDQVPSTSFLDLRSLLTLSLLGNRITSIKADAFHGLSKLTNLYLSGNHIYSIHPRAFSGLRSLQQLELQNNALSQLNDSTFDNFNTNLKEIKLFNNPWFCDCNLRWLIHWLKNSSETGVQRLKWKYPQEEPMCNGPSIVDQRSFSSLTGEWFICPIRLYSKARNIETIPGKDVELFCKYTADPHVDIQWLKNGIPIDLNKKRKFKVEYKGVIMTTSRLQIYDFRYKDIGEYECYAENKLGRAFDSCLVTLQGVDPAIVLQPSMEDEDASKDRIRNAIIATATIGGVVFLLVILVIIFCCVRRCKRYQHKKKESIRMSFEEHLKANGIIEPNPKNEPIVYDSVPDGTLSIDDDMEERDSVYDSLQRPSVPSSTNTNTYISFKTEFSEPEDVTQMCTQGQQTTSSHSKGSDGSQCESTSPLLENISPILIDPNDPFYEANLYVPRLYASTNNYLSSTHNGDYEDDPRYHKQRKIERFESEFIPVRDEHGFILPSKSTAYNTPYRSATLPHNGHVLHSEPQYIPHRNRTLPHGYSAQHMTEYASEPVVRSNSVSINPMSASVGHLGISPPKKPPRSFNSRDTVSLYSQNSLGEREGGLKLSLPKPGTVDKYGTAV
ncbi:leucine-rich repeat-containing protein 24-like [Mya arenaria]|uniref:leucine-rich repeat-containing protein 24-like n=1 Tax=Mya arenaria TaxID=6604 RepID=UPI0022DF6FAB|nr:leucine-rich repeat-containing protein 24-like [Mya arenaria]XP_052792326.1 leucine-rich repeat-containing protein 24-like [Mya arenaria]XP_052792327.1 leucine-rich repeat-containing protein 24-like [Mya arenaria]